MSAIEVLRVDFKSADADKRFVESLLNTGFGVITNHPIDYQMVRDVFAEWDEFFNSDYKMKYAYNNDTQDGLFPSETAVGAKVKDIKEFFHYYEWGQYPSELSNKTKLLAAQMLDVSVTLLQWIEKHLPENIRSQLSQSLYSMVKGSPQNLLRIIHYPPLTGNEEPEAIRAAAHTDINMLTTLVAASESGLETQDLHGNWISVPVDPGMLSINIGDMLEEATGGFFKANMHRVINPVTPRDRSKSRFSIPLFLHAAPNVVLSKRGTAGEFLHDRLVALGIKKPY